MNKYFLAGFLVLTGIAGVAYLSLRGNEQTFQAEAVTDTQAASATTSMTEVAFASSTSALVDPADESPEETLNDILQQRDPVPAEKPAPQPKPAPAPAPVPEKIGISIAEVAQHNSKTSCWTAINGSVYDLTSYISKHPGGARKILSLCGVDGTRSFMRQHSGDTKPEQILASLRIDSLAL